MTQRGEKSGWVWITGGSQGIGKALALELAKRGRNVIVSARSREKLEAVAEESRFLAGKVETAPLDVTDRQATAAAIAEIEKNQGEIAVSVLNAGTHEPVDASNFDPDVFERLMAINVMGVTNCLGPLIERMKTREGGRIAVVASLSGYTGLPTASAYGASKAALINMTEAMKVELEPHGIRMQIVNPGFVKTPLTDRNTFEMPFLIPAERAARAFADGLDSNRFEIVFPRRFAYILKLVRCLPYPIRFAITRRMVPKGDQ